MAKELLQWAIANSDPTQQQTDDETKAESKKIDSEIIDVILGKGDAVRMREAIDVISNSEETLKNREIALDNLELLVEQIDNATDIENMNLWPRLISFLSLPEKSLRLNAVWVCGTAVQNNPMAQKAFTERGGLKIVLDLLKNALEDVDIRSKALYAVSGAINHYPPGLTQFEKEGGYEALLTLLKTSENLPTLRKTVFLFNNLLLQNPTTVAMRIEEKGLVSQIIKLLATFGEQDEDFADKVLRLILTLCQSSSKSLSEGEVKELKRILPELRERYQDVTLSKEEWDKLEKEIN